MIQTVVPQGTRTENGPNLCRRYRKTQEGRGEASSRLLILIPGFLPAYPTRFLLLFSRKKKSFNVQFAKEKEKPVPLDANMRKLRNILGNYLWVFPSPPAFKSWPFHDRYLIHTWDWLRKWSSFWSSSSRPSLPSLTGKLSREIIKSSEIWLYIIYFIS